MANAFEISIRGRGPGAGGRIVKFGAGETDTVVTIATYDQHFASAEQGRGVSIACDVECAGLLTSKRRRFGRWNK
jgi:hypothetical protein